MQEAFLRVHAREAHQSGFSGHGIGVAVLDTGIFPHADLKNRLAVFQNMLGSRRYPFDDCGHGTHVAGIIGGDGRQSGGYYRGIAPGCHLAGIKVLDNSGDGNADDMIAGLQWIQEHYRRYNIRIVNISAGAQKKSMCTEASEMIRKVEALWDEGLVIVAAAGNDGPGEGTVTAPGVSRKIITVGCPDGPLPATVPGKVREHHSGRGPTAECIMKPEVVAPGTVISCRVCPRPGTPSYISKSGTSMAAPIVSGAIALLLEKEPELTNVQIKLRLRESCIKKEAYPGWGMLHIGRLLALE